MRFGLFYQLRFPEPWSSEKEQRCLWEAIEQITYAEEMGFEGLWLTEHHFVPAWSAASAPEVMLTAISQRTSRMRLGFAVVLSPIHHPLHIAVKAATLDLLSNGRVDLGMGRASTPYQLTPFGVNLADTRGMTDEALTMIPRMWTEEVFSHEGEYYQIPPRAVVPKPVQKPHPPIWSACQQEDTCRLAGELGLGCLLNTRYGPERVETFINTYKKAIKEAQPVGKFINNHVVASTVTFCDENNQRAREKGAVAAAEQIFQTRIRNQQDWAAVSEDSVPPDYIHHFRRAQHDPIIQAEVTPESLLDNGGYCIGDPDACIKFVERYETLGVEEIMLALQLGAATHQDVMNSLRLFGKYVIPHFREKEKQAAAVGLLSPGEGRSESGFVRRGS